jgi:hypothetical protein
MTVFLEVQRFLGFENLLVAFLVAFSVKKPHVEIVRELCDSFARFLKC